MAATKTGTIFTLPTSEMYPYLKSRVFEVSSHGYINNFDPIPNGLRQETLVKLLRNLADDIEALKLPSPEDLAF